MVIKDGAKNLGMFSNRHENSFQDSGYTIANDMSSWQLAIVTGKGDSFLSNNGTSKFYNAAEGSSTVHIVVQPTESPAAQFSKELAGQAKDQGRWQLRINGTES